MRIENGRESTCLASHSRRQCSDAVSRIKGKGRGVAVEPGVSLEENPALLASDGAVYLLGNPMHQYSSNFQPPPSFSGCLTAL